MLQAHYALLHGGSLLRWYHVCGSGGSFKGQNVSFQETMKFLRSGKDDLSDQGFAAMTFCDRILVLSVNCVVVKRVPLSGLHQPVTRLLVRSTSSYSRHSVTWFYLSH